MNDVSFNIWFFLKNKIFDSLKLEGLSFFYNNNNLKNKILDLIIELISLDANFTYI